MTGLSAWEVQKGVYAKLSGDVTLSSMVTNEYDFVPEDSGFPYIALGEAREQDYSTLSTKGAAVELDIHVFSRDRGKKASFQVLSRIYDLLHDQSVTVTGFTAVNVRFVNARVFLESDGITYHGISKFRIITESN
jgi:hypothetical protein